MVFSVVEDQQVPHHPSLPYLDICKSLLMHGQTERRKLLRGEVGAGTGRGGKIVAVGDGEEGRFDCPHRWHLCSIVHTVSTSCPCSAGSYITLQNSLLVPLLKIKLKSYLFLHLHYSCHVIKCYHVIKEDLEGVYTPQCSIITVNSSFMASKHLQ